MADDDPAKPQRLTIAEFTDNYGPEATGLLYAVQFLEEQTLAAGHKVWLVAPDSKPPAVQLDHPNRREVRLPSIKVPTAHVRLSMGRDFDYRLAQMEAHPPDVIHVHGLGTIGLLGMWLSQRTGKPLVVTWHTDFEAYAEHYWHLAPLLNAAYKVFRMRVNGSWRELMHPRPTRPRRGKAQVQLLKVAAQMLSDADLVTTPSEKTANRVLEIAPKAKVRVVPNGSDPLPVLTQLPKAKGPRLLYVGRISAEKGIGLMLDAFELVRDEVPNAELMIAGDWQLAGPGLRLRLKSAQKFGGVNLAGLIPHDKLGSYYAAADLFVFTSLTDTQALVLHEAAHAGLPIVLTDHELRLVVDPGVNALLARPNPVSLAHSILEMLEALQDPDFAARARARSQELAAQWSIERQSKEFVEIYQALAAGRQVPLTEGLRPAIGRPWFGERAIEVDVMSE